MKAGILSEDFRSFDILRRGGERHRVLERLAQPFLTYERQYIELNRIEFIDFKRVMVMGGT
ncbi:hypothetical protein D3C79_957630 [compost metagenome]